MALPGWSPAPPPAAPLPSNGSGSRAVGNLRPPQPMGGRHPGPLLFLSLRLLPERSAVATLSCGAVRCFSASRFHPHAELTLEHGPQIQRDLAPRTWATLHRSSGLFLCICTRVSPTIARSRSLGIPRRSRTTQGAELAYGRAQITQVGGARAPHPHQHGSVAVSWRAASKLHTSSSASSGE